jgi:glycosyltransferase involved in cell wall biosynthesis
MSAARKILFVATEDWFIRSHFLPLIRGAAAMGLQPLAAARMGEAADDIARAGAELRPLTGARGGYDPALLWRQAGELRALFARERPAIIHTIALKPSFLGALSSSAAPSAGLVMAITGFGYLAANSDPVLKAGRGFAISMITHYARRANTRLVFENEHDRRKFAKRGAPDAHMFVVPGAGVDAAALTPAPEPPSAPIRVGMASRLLRSKGLESALDAIAALRAEGHDIRLQIAGAPDPENPASFSAEDVAAWGRRGGVECIGWTNDINAFWAGVHIALAPSLGGEGLPKSLLEAAACGRAIVTTDAPGCRDFVRDNENGLLALRGDAAGLARAIATLAGDATLRARLGAQARRDIENGYTTHHVVAEMSRAWRSLLRD